LKRIAAAARRSQPTPRSQQRSPPLSQLCRRARQRRYPFDDQKSVDVVSHAWSSSPKSRSCSR
jgi:hypothetical protein